MGISGLPGDENPNPQWKLPREESRWQSQWTPETPDEASHWQTQWTPEATPEGEEPPRWVTARTAPSNVSGRAVGALIVAILGLSFCPLVGSIVALVMAYGAKREIDSAGGARGVAVAAIVLGWVGIVIYGLLGALIGIGIAVS